MTVYGVVNGHLLALYTQAQHAETHSRTVTGSRVIALEVHDTLPDHVLDDIASDDWAEGDTPVQEPDHLSETQPSTPRAKTRRGGWSP